MNINIDSHIGAVAAQDYKASSVFRQAGIDFCCQGNRTIADACAKKGIDPHTIVAELQQKLQSHSDTVQNIDYKSWPLDLLIDYIEKKHHRYVREEAPVLQAMLDKITKVHGAGHPELASIRDLFAATAAELSAHMMKEELILFPNIRKLLQHQDTAPSFGSVQGPIAKMMAEHQTEGERFAKIAALSNDYTPPSDACGTYIAAYQGLEAFEQDLHLHIHLENNLIFPQAIAIETAEQPA